MPISECIPFLPTIQESIKNDISVEFYSLFPDLWIYDGKITSEVWGLFKPGSEPLLCRWGIESLGLPASDWRSSLCAASLGVCFSVKSWQRQVSNISFSYNIVPSHSTPFPHSHTHTWACYRWSWLQGRLTSKAQSPRQSFILPKSGFTDQHKQPELLFHYCNPRDRLPRGSRTSTVPRRSSSLTSTLSYAV